MKTLRTILLLSAMAGLAYDNSFTMKRTTLEAGQEAHDQNNQALAQEGLFIALPIEVIQNIVAFLPSAGSFGNLSQVCKQLKYLCYTLPPESIVYINILEIIQNETYKAFFEETFLMYLMNNKLDVIKLLVINQKNAYLGGYRFSDSQTALALTGIGSPTAIKVAQILKHTEILQLLLKHTGTEKQYYTCSYQGCDKAFAQEFHLERHMRTMHNPSI